MAKLTCSLFQVRTVSFNFNKKVFYWAMKIHYKSLIFTCNLKKWFGIILCFYSRKTSSLPFHGRRTSIYLTLTCKKKILILPIDKNCVRYFYFSILMFLILPFMSEFFSNIINFISNFLRNYFLIFQSISFQK